jgi:phenylacetate-CoA ligase
MSLLSMRLEQARSIVADGYEDLPDVVQDVVCSVYGAQELVRRRGTPRQAARGRAGIERLHWDASASARLVRDRLGRIQGLARELPGYSKAPSPAEDPVEELDAWPILTKDALRQMPDGYFARELTGTDIRTWTSGTTGGALAVWKPRSSVRELFLSRDVFMGWHGVSPTDRRATFTGKVAVPQDSSRVWRLNAPGRQMVLSQYHIAPDQLDAYFAVLARWRPTVLSGFPSTIAGLARLLRERDARLHVPVVECSGEVLTDPLRSLLSEVFNARVVNKYGSSENVAYACECPAGRLHVFEGFGIIEVVDDEGRRLPAGEPGRILMTSLTNDLMPMVRYEVGDIGVLGPVERCGCGRTSATLLRVEGRQDDTLITRDGRVGITSGVFNLLRGTEGLEAVQLVQQSYSEFEVRAVLDENKIERVAFEDRVRTGLDRLLGQDPERTVRVVYVEELERTPVGKIRNTIRLFTP